MTAAARQLTSSRRARLRLLALEGYGAEDIKARLSGDVPLRVIRRAMREKRAFPVMLEPRQIYVLRQLARARGMEDAEELAAEIIEDWLNKGAAP